MRTDARLASLNPITFNQNNQFLISYYNNIMVDSEDIIRAVKKQPAIWDLDNEGYHNKNLKDQAWDGVCVDLIRSWSSLPQGMKYVKQLEIKKKWNNIRDYYKKLLSETRPGEQEVRAKKRRYLYSNLLEFIRPVYDKNRVEYNIDSAVSAGGNADSDDHRDSDTEPQELQILTNVYPFKTVPKRKSISDTPKPNSNQNQTKKEESMTVFERTIIKTLENKMSRDDDPDLLFLKSLLPDMKKLKPNEKFNFKIGIMELYRNISNGNQAETNDHCDDHDYSIDPHEPQVKVETVRLSVDDDSYNSYSFSEF